MHENKKNPILRIIGGVWQGLSIARQTLWNMLFLFILLVLIVGAFSSNKPSYDKGSALIVSPSGALVEQIAGDPLEQARALLTGRDRPQTLLRDLIKAIELAKDDKKIELIVLRLDDLDGGGLAKLELLSTALATFRESGKKMLAIADNYDTTNYYLAAQADEVLLHPMGMVLIQGYSRYGTYYKELIDNLKIDWNVFKVGTYKSAVEPYLRNNMSEAAKEANLDWIGDLWDSYKNAVAKARKKTPDEIQHYVDDFPAALEAKQGDTARLALDAGLVDRLSGRIETRDYLVGLVGEDDDGLSYKRIGFEDYLEAKGIIRAGHGYGDGVGVIVASGLIEDGTRPPGTIGGDSTAALIRQARKDDKIKAIVLRVDSPGGSAFASEVIRQELAKAREEGKPVIVSMGQVAASGGYWISTASDEIWASPNTITGSIGIFGMFPTFQRSFAQIGIHVDGVGTTKMAGALRQDRELSKEAGQAIQQIINQGYQDFIERVAEARDMKPEEVDKIGQGRVWSGLDAQRIGLVDQLGSLDDAIASAAKHAQLEDDYAVHYITKKLSLREKLMADLMQSIARVTAPTIQATLPKLPGMEFLERVQQELTTIERMNDPRGVYAYCPCNLN